MWLSLFIIAEIVTLLFVFTMYISSRCKGDLLNCSEFVFLLVFSHSVVYGFIGLVYLLCWIWCLDL
ncbi:MAG: hypothetical protein DRM99_02415 [Thermoplasmata archaeon]|nr:MAG: hypothetical protein DRM99_02415 [Thermoplasmata archaeon]